MLEKGIVIKVEGEFAEVKFERQSACLKCGKCTYFGSERKFMVTEVLNSAEAKVGDEVEVMVSSKSHLTAVFVLFVVPFCAFFLGVILGHYLFKANSNISSMIFGFAFLILSYVWAKGYDNRIKGNRDYLPKIVRIIKAL